jgi:Flp pilus assembly protein TadD
MINRTAFSLALAAAVLAGSANASWAESALAKKETIHRCLLQIYVSQRKGEAAGEYNALLAMKPADGQLHYDYANFLLRGGNNAAAAGQYRLATKYQPRNADFQIGLGNALLHAKDYNGAVNAYRRAVEIGGATGTQSPTDLLNRALQYQQQQTNFENYKKQQKDNE